ncbi:hypothetical protein Pka01_03350 [Planotetraspora kaengkrachanensis]|uniref:Uncharacterized protein n=1 Tax=Planotetraspora kaengkrachanensis TaxID=575193 RepID=A0A8J3PQR8_9ACTN|nr:hypothetical protein Pka01_03350 [Planotetraspora kaengkrachanensis]
MTVAAALAAALLLLPTVVTVAFWVLRRHRERLVPLMRPALRGAWYEDYVPVLSEASSPNGYCFATVSGVASSPSPS